MIRVPLVASMLVALSFGPQVTTAQQVLPQGHVIVLAEPNTLTLPLGLTRVPAAVAQVERSGLREIFTRHGISAVRRAAPHWDEFRQSAPAAKVHARRKNEMMPPDALADLSLMFVLEFPDGVDVRKIVDELNATEGIVYAEADAPIESLAVRDRRPVRATGKAASAVLSPNDPLFVQGLNWGFNGTWGVRAVEAWDIQTGSPSIKIAIFDTGIETTHPDFGAGSRIADQYDFVNGDGDAFPDDDQRLPYHGIAVTGVAAAQTNDNFGSAGMCGGFAPANPGCSILAAKTMGTLNLWQQFTGWLGLTSVVGDATSWALARGAKVINNSWCNESVHRSVHDAFRNAYLSHALVTAAAGNTEYIPEMDRWRCDQDSPSDQVVPSAFGDILMAVGATDENGRRVVTSTWQSGYGPSVVAPGINHWSDGLGGTIRPFGGTSEATPFVSGLAGLIYSEAAAKGITLTAWDVRQIIENTARPPFNIPAGYQLETGWGIIDAAKALQVLQAPNQLTFVTLGPNSGANCYSQEPIEPWTFWASWQVLFARRCEVRQAVTFGKRYATPPIVWGRPVSNGGVTPSNPNSEIFFTGAVPGSVTTTGAIIRTYVYELWTYPGGEPLGWWPAPRNQVGFGYAVLGEVAPFDVSAAAPCCVTVKATYSVTGSASDPATGWLWERSTDGSPFIYWSNNQNSQFVAYAGDYTLDWRLGATRNFDSARDTGYATTRVCIPANPSCYAYAAPEPGPVVTNASPVSVTVANVNGDHFGSGWWIGFPDGAAGHVLRAYSFHGTRDPDVGRSPWPNVLERDGGNWTYASQRGTIALATRRYPAGSDRTLVRVSGRLERPGARTRVHVGLAADPDLGEPSDDAIGFDPEMGLVWVREGGADGRHVGYLALASNEMPRLRQFGMGLDDESESAADALALMTAPTKFAADRSADIHFLLTVPEVAVGTDGRFEATFAVLHAPSYAALLELARATKLEQTTLVAGIPAEAPAAATGQGGFALRQSLGRALPAASMTGSSTEDGQPSVARLQAEGITGLDYAVPEGREVPVRIRIYNSRGQLVRILVDQAVPGGAHHVEWDRLNERGQQASPGVYVAVMEAEGFRATRKLVLTQ